MVHYAAELDSPLLQGNPARQFLSSPLALQPNRQARAFALPRSYRGTGRAASLIHRAAQKKRSQEPRLRQPPFSETNLPKMWVLGNFKTQRKKRDLSIEGAGCILVPPQK